MSNGGPRTAADSLALTGHGTEAPPGLLCLPPLLARYGMQTKLIESDERGLVLRVVNPAGPSTHVYVPDQPRSGGPEVYGFTNLCIGLVAEPQRVAARLAWLLGAAERSPQKRNEIKKADDMPMPETKQQKQRHPVLLTPSEVAQLFRVDPKTVARWADKGQLPFVRTLGGHRRYRSADVLPHLQLITMGNELSEAANGDRTDQP